MGGTKESTREPSADGKSKRKRPVEFVNYMHPDEAKQKDNLRRVRQTAMNHHLFENNSPDLPENMRVSRLPHRLRPPFTRNRETSLSGRKLKRAASVPKEPNTRGLLPPASDDKLTRRVSVDVFPQRAQAPSVASPIAENPQVPPQSEDSLAEAFEDTVPFRRDTFPPQQSAGLQDHIRILSHNCDTFFRSEDLDRIWRVRGEHDRTFALSALCVSARHTESLSGSMDSVENLTLDTEVVQSMLQKMRDPHEQTSDNTIAAALHLAICHNYRVSDHVDWYDMIRTMVEQRGGLENLDTFPFLSSAVLINGLASAILHEKAPHQIFLSAASETAPNPSQNLESPICWTGNSLSRLENSVRCPKPLLALLQAVRHAVDVVTTGSASPRTRRNRYQAQKLDIRSQLLTFRQVTNGNGGAETPTSSRRTRGNTGNRAMNHEAVCVYEACRVAAIILERALYYGVPLSEAMKGKELLHSLKEALLQTNDLDTSWGDMAGVLLWAAYVGAAASNGAESTCDDAARQVRAWFVGCATRVTIKMAFSNPKEIIRALYTFSRIQEVCDLGAGQN